MAEAAPAFLGVTRSLTGRRWRARAQNERLVQALAQRLGVPELVARVLAGRGVGLEQGDNFLNPTLRDLLPDPSRFHDMDRAAARVARAIQSGEAIAVFGDYDVDGATSAALLKLFCRAVGADIRVYVPDRIREGYGPNAPALLKLAAEGARLVITVDCGTLAYGALAAAAAAGLEVIVVDHHLAEPALPAALAVINPNRLDESGHHRQLAAVGVAYLLVVAVNRALRAAGWYAARPEPNLLQWLDLVALGTVCDVVPLTGVNRALVGQGLKLLAQRGNIGLAALADVAGLHEPPGCFHLGFLLGPRVNAGGRVGQADLGAQLLTTTDPAEAATLARELDRLNAERRAIESMVQEDATARALADGEAAAAATPLIVAAGRGWHQGVIGIVAARLKERFRRPALVVALDGGIGKGSARSVPGVDLGSAVTAARQAGLLINGGGHAMAAGLTVAEERLAELVDFLRARLAPQVAKLAAVASLGLDGALAVGGATADLLDLLDRAGPYGPGHAEPRFAVAGARVVQPVVVGAKHVRCTLLGPDGSRLKAVAFRALENGIGEALLRSDGLALHVAGALRADHWRGERRVQLVIEDAARAAGAG
ncbi:MAG TPA: single-stranded-DNA-specific exonuclease RecJ [Candidatus Sulfotelmatobacter sp.]|nr:single-stranded-DNA-specific exonuclease RecJ [Candidatus Sulfotelmatobacter sp.]